MSEVSKNQSAWQKLFDKYRILDGIEHRYYFSELSSGITGLSNNLIINIFMVLYPESMMIYNIIEKVL